ncbi:hypothetical protein EV363DRAFT_1456894 [Boletus edulis]|nr:hypothetical protein EV363DRAFT_1456894 [Boletus edulis]
MALPPCRPFHSSPDAPRFDASSPSHLPGFLEDVDLLGTGLRLDTAGKIKLAMYYAPLDDAELWELLPEASAHIPDWNVFVSAVKKYYPGCEKTDRYCRADLYRLVQDFRTKSMSTLEAVGLYYRQFRKVALPLVASHRLSDLERDNLFMSGFPDSVMLRIHHRLSIVRSDIHPCNPYPMSDVKDAAVFLLSRSSSRPLPSLSPPVDISVSQSVPPPVPVPCIPHLPSTSPVVLASPIHVEPMPLRSPEFLPSQVRTKSCAFCDEPGHAIWSCAHADTYIQVGRFIRSTDKRLYFTDGAPIPRLPGIRCIKGYIDRLLAEQSMAPSSTIPHTSPSPPLTAPLPVQVRTAAFQSWTPSSPPGLRRTIVRSPELFTPVQDAIDPSIFSLSADVTSFTLDATDTSPQETKISGLYSGLPTATASQPGHRTNQSEVIPDPDIIVVSLPSSALIIQDALPTPVRTNTFPPTVVSVLVHPSKGLDITVAEPVASPTPIPMVSKYFLFSPLFPDFIPDYCVSPPSSRSIVGTIIDHVSIIPTFPIWRSDVPDPPDYSPWKSAFPDFRPAIFSSLLSSYRTQSCFKNLIHPSDVLTIGSPQISAPPSTRLSEGDDQEVIIQSSQGGETQLQNSSCLVPVIKNRDFPFSDYKSCIPSLRYKSALPRLLSGDLRFIPGLVRCIIQSSASISFAFTISSEKQTLKNPDSRTLKSYSEYTIPSPLMCPNIIADIDLHFARVSGHYALFPSCFRDRSGLVRFSWSRRRKRRRKPYE